MTLHERASEFPVPPKWIRVLLGIALVVAGLLVLGDIATARFVSALFIALVAIAAGAFEIIHAFWTKGWGGFVWHVLPGALYLAFGLVLLNQPEFSALILAYVLGLLLVLSGLVRLLLSLSHWREAGWVMLLSGAFGILAGLVVLTGFPSSELWMIGLMLGIDLLAHGLAWLGYGWFTAARAA